MTSKNTKKMGVARTIIFKEGKKYKAVCLDLDIIEEGDSQDEVRELIKESIIGYIENVCKNGLDEKLLNRHADEKYWKMFRDYLKKIQKPQINESIGNTSMFTMNIDKEEFCNV